MAKASRPLGVREGTLGRAERVHPSVGKPGETNDAVAAMAGDRIGGESRGVENRLTLPLLDADCRRLKTPWEGPRASLSGRRDLSFLCVSRCCFILSARVKRLEQPS